MEFGLLGGTIGAVAAPTSGADTRDFLLFHKAPPREVNQLALRDAAELSGGLQIGSGVAHSGIGLPLKIPGGLSGCGDSADGLRFMG
jgi:hypothetical protein